MISSISSGRPTVLEEMGNSFVRFLGSQRVGDTTNKTKHVFHKGAITMNSSHARYLPLDPQAFGGDQSLQLRAYLPAMPDDMLLTAREVSLIISPHNPNVLTIYQLRAKGRLKATKVGKKLWFSAADVREYLGMPSGLKD